MGEKRYLTVQVDYHKVQIPVDEIMYVTIDGRKTKLSMADGTSVRTNRALKDVFGALPEDTFSNINRGIVVSNSYVEEETGGVLTMRDGTQFRRRVRSDRSAEPRGVPAGRDARRRDCPVEELNWWMGELPVPMCIMELVYKQKGGSSAFVMRYCNVAMEGLLGLRFTEIRDHPVSALPGIGSRKWLTTFADVAINGGARVIEDTWDESGKFMRIHCYQPQSGSCTLLMTDLTRENNLIQRLFQREN